MGTDDEWCVPVPDQRRIVLARLRLDIDALAASSVVTHQYSILGLGVNYVGVSGIDAGLIAITARRDKPVAIADAMDIGRSRRSPHRSVILGSAVNVVKRQCIIHANPVELGYRQVGDVSPRLCPIPGLVNTPVATHHQIIRIIQVEV